MPQAARITLARRGSKISAAAAISAGELIASHGIHGTRPLEILFGSADNPPKSWWMAAVSKILDLELARRPFHAQAFAYVAARVDAKRSLDYWSRILRLFARSKRTEMLERLMPMLGWLFAMGGEQELSQTAVVLEQAFEWWP